MFVTEWWGLTFNAPLGRVAGFELDMGVQVITPTVETRRFVTGVQADPFLSGVDFHHGYSSASSPYLLWQLASTSSQLYHHRTAELQGWSPSTDTFCFLRVF